MATVLELIQQTTQGNIDNRPFAQILRGNASTQKGVGVFITVEQAEKCGWKASSMPGTGWAPHKHTFGDDEDSTPGYINSSPKMVIVKASRLGMFSVETKRYVRDYDEDLYKGFDRKPLSWFTNPENSGAKQEVRNKLLFDLRTKYMVFFLGVNNEFLHELPLQLTCRGCAGASFGSELKAFKNEFCGLIKQKKKKNDNFWIQVVFQPIFKSEKKDYGGGSNTAARVVGYVVPSLEKLEEIVILEQFNPDKYAFLVDTLKSLKDYGWVLDLSDDQSPVDYNESPTKSSKAPAISEEGSALLSSVRNAMTKSGVEPETSETSETEEDLDIPF